jgi:transposase
MPRRRIIDIPDPELTDEQWDRLAEWLPEESGSPRGGPKPVPNRPVVEGILWVLRNGGRWKALPRGYPSPSTCWRRLCDWEESGVWLDVWRAFLDTLEEQGRLRWDECFADGSFAPAKKGAPGSEKPSGARVRSGWWWSMAKEFRWHATSPAPRRRR